MFPVVVYFHLYIPLSLLIGFYNFLNGPGSQYNSINALENWYCAGPPATLRLRDNNVPTWLFWHLQDQGLTQMWYCCFQHLSQGAFQVRIEPPQHLINHP